VVWQDGMTRKPFKEGNVLLGGFRIYPFYEKPGYHRNCESDDDEFCDIWFHDDFSFLVLGLVIP
jgi:hypothetical protein